MHRTRGKVLGVAAACAAASLLVACGDNDSTASSTPSLTGTTSAPSSVVSSAPSVSSQAPAPAPAPESTESATPERPEPVPTASQQDTSGLPDRDKKFLDSLQSQGVTPSSPDIALSIGAYVCQGVAAGASEADLSTFVNAMAGSDPSFDPAKMPVEKAGKIYIDTAKQTYCQ